jgi:hypothetical protein
MKSMLFVVLGLLLVGTLANAAQLSTVPGPSYVVSITDRAPVQFTQNSNTTLIEPVQVACGLAGISTNENWYLRRFDLAGDHGVVGALTVSSVQFGVEQITAAGYSVDLKIYAMSSAAAITFAAMGPAIASVSVPIALADQGTIKTVPIVGVIPAGMNLVVAIYAADASALSLQFRPGANSAVCIADAMIASAACGLPEPTNVSAIGFPTSQTIFVVNGDDESGGVPVELSSWGQVKSIYR